MRTEVRFLPTRAQKMRCAQSRPLGFHRTTGPGRTGRAGRLVAGRDERDERPGE